MGISTPQGKKFHIQTLFVIHDSLLELNILRRITIYLEDQENPSTTLIHHKAIKTLFRGSKIHQEFGTQKIIGKTTKMLNNLKSMEQLGAQ